MRLHHDRCRLDGGWQGLPEVLTQKSWVTLRDTQARDDWRRTGYAGAERSGR
jgi:hypothetical protein